MEIRLFKDNILPALKVRLSVGNIQLKTKITLPSQNGKVIFVWQIVLRLYSIMPPMLIQSLAFIASTMSTRRI